MGADELSLYAPDKNLVLAASAGTGKTHALVGVVVHLLVVGPNVPSARARVVPVDPSRIVATTFSRKAASEIRARVSLELDKLASAPETSAYFASLRAREEARGAEVGARLAARARKALTRMPQARFGTLHSFATGIVRSYAVELGLGPGFELASEADARARIDDALAAALEARLATNADAIRALADAASGIDGLVSQLRRILVQLEEDGRSARDLAVETSDAPEIERRLDQLARHARDLTQVPRFEAVARDFLSAHGGHDAERLEEATAALMAMPATGKKVDEVDSFAIFRKELPGATNEEKGRRLARTFQNRHLFAERASLVRAIVGDAERTIESEGRARATLGFGEILRAARELLRDRPDVADEVSEGIDALLVDEFQDTSRVQRDLLALLWARPQLREGGHVPPLSALRERGLLVVGDRKQSIYGFRGADVGVFAELAVGLAGEPARQALGIPMGVTWQPEEPLAHFRALRHNRRSVAEILTFANAFSAERFVPGLPPELYEIDYVPETEDLLVPPERVTRDDASAAPRTRWLRIAPKGNASSRLEEALVIAERVAGLVAGPAMHLGTETRAPQYRHIAVLATTNGMLDAMAFALAQWGIPYVVAGRSFFRTREVRDLAALLALVLDPSDRLAALEVLRGPWTGLHDETLLGLTRDAEGLSTPSSWSHPPRPELIHPGDRAALAETRRVVMELATMTGRLGAGTLLREAVRSLRLEEVLLQLPRGEQRVANVRKLLAIADRHVDARSFHAWLDEATSQELKESEAATFSEEDDAVRLLTVHASKGLDFPIVFVPEIAAALPRVDKGVARVTLGGGGEPNRLAVRLADPQGMVLEPPSFARAHEISRRRERAERQRLAYVAITRAADAMFFVGGVRKAGSGDAGISSVAALELLAETEATRHRAQLVVEDVDVPPAPFRADEAGAGSPPPAAAPSAEVVRAIPRWRSLPIAPTALSDFAHCARRFELVHVLGLPEHVRGGRSIPAESPAARQEGATLDARTQGTLAHAVLERIPTTAFAGGSVETVTSQALEQEGVPSTHPQHAVIVGRVNRFLRGDYAGRIGGGDAELRREVPFVLRVEDDAGKAVVLRGSMDLLVRWPDGSIDVVDYKSGRSSGGAKVESSGAYAFQLDVYALAARGLFPDAPRLRAGLVFLGGNDPEPVWRVIPDEATIRERLVALGRGLVEARWTDRFPRVSIDRCEAIFCGFIGRCHAKLAPSGAGASKGTDDDDDPATTT